MISDPYDLQLLPLASSWLLLGMALYIRATGFFPFNPQVSHNETYPYLFF